MPRGRPATWTIEEDIKLITRRAAGNLPAQISDALARTTVAINARLQYHGACMIVGAKRVVAEGSYGIRHKSRAWYDFTKQDISPSIVPEVEVVIPILKHTSLTALICGDPLPGRSALDTREPPRKVTLYQIGGAP